MKLGDTVPNFVAPVSPSGEEIDFHEAIGALCLHSDCLLSSSFEAMHVRGRAVQRDAELPHNTTDYECFADFLLWRKSPSEATAARPQVASSATCQVHSFEAFMQDLYHRARLQHTRVVMNNGG